MHQLISDDTVRGLNRGKVRIVTQVAVARAISVRHLGHHRIKLVFRIETEPETDRVEHMPERARLRQQVYARWLGYAQMVKLRAQPDRALPLTGITAVIAIAPVGDIGTVHREQRRRFTAMLGVEKNVVDGIAKGVLNSALSPMKSVACDMVNRIHATFPILPVNRSRRILFRNRMYQILRFSGQRGSK